MTLDEAIKHAEEVAEQKECKMTSDDGYTDVSMKRCAEEHRQLAEWLKELKGYKDKNEPKLVIYSGDGYADGKIVYDWADCPSCSFTIEKGDADWEMPFCPNCGQAWKWEEEE